MFRYEQIIHDDEVLAKVAKMGEAGIPIAKIHIEWFIHDEENPGEFYKTHWTEVEFRSWYEACKVYSFLQDINVGESYYEMTLRICDPQYYYFEWVRACSSFKQRVAHPEACFFYFEGSRDCDGVTSYSVRQFQYFEDFCDLHGALFEA